MARSLLQGEETLIRRAQPADAAPLAHLLIDAWRVAYRGLVPDAHLAAFDYGRRTERFREQLADRASDTDVAEQAGKVVGFVTFGACRDDDVGPGLTGEIWGIYLAPAHWRRGIGTLLCRHAEGLLRSRGYTQAKLWVLEGNAQARRFYEAMGFHPDGASRLLELGAPRTAVRYGKALEPPA